MFGRLVSLLLLVMLVVGSEDMPPSSSRKEEIKEGPFLQDKVFQDALLFSRKYYPPLSWTLMNGTALFVISAHLDGNCQRASLRMCIESIEGFHPYATIIVVCNSCERSNPQLLSIESRGHFVLHNNPAETSFSFELGALQVVHAHDLVSHDFVVLLQHTTWLVRPVPFANLTCDVTPFYFFWGMSFDTIVQQQVFSIMCHNALISLASRLEYVRHSRTCTDPTGGGVFGPNVIFSARAADAASHLAKLGGLSKLETQSTERMIGVLGSWMGCPPSATALDGEIGDTYPCGFWSQGYCPPDKLWKSGVHLGKVWGTLSTEC